jgi:hypothetical protein
VAKKHGYKGAKTPRIFRINKKNKTPCLGALVAKKIKNSVP